MNSTHNVPGEELAARLERLRRRLNASAPEWRAAMVVGKVNLYYLTGTMPSGALVIPRDEEAVLWVRRSVERSRAESAFPRIEPMRGFRDLAQGWPRRPDCLWIEKDVMTLGHLERLNKHLGIRRFEALDAHLGALRAVKSPFELAQMEEAGRIHRRILEEEVPGMLREGMSEAELGARVLDAMIRAGHHGVTRIAMFDTELFLGNVCFGENSLRANPFDGPGGLAGVGPAVPLFADHHRRLRRGDLIYLDVGCGYQGYHTDKTMIYAFGPLPDQALEAHRRCVAIQDAMAERLRPGTVPAELYEEVMNSLEAKFLRHFMGYGDQSVRFLGHGVGLHIDEMPVIAKGFDQPLEANMTLALEPKKGVDGVGMVGIENTFVVTPQGGRSLTGRNPGPICV